MHWRAVPHQLFASILGLDGRTRGVYACHAWPWSYRMDIDPRIPILCCRDGARRVFTDRADIVCTKREEPWRVLRDAQTVSYILLRTVCEVGFLAYG